VVAQLDLAKIVEEIEEMVKRLLKGRLPAFQKSADRQVPLTFF